MKKALTLGAMLLVSTVPDSIQLAPEAGRTLTKTFESKMELELTALDRSFSIDGEEQEVPEMDLPEVNRVITETIVFVDEYAKVEDGEIRQLKRTFKDLSGEETSSEPGPPDGEIVTETTESESELEGLTVVFDYDEDAEEFDASYGGDEEGDDDLLTELMMGADFAELLPDEDVEKGDKWEIEASAYEVATTPGGELAIISDEDDVERDKRMNEMFRENLEGTIEFEHLGTDTEGERELLVLGFSGEMTSEFEEEDEQDGRSMTMTFNVTVEVEGKLFWDASAGHAARFESMADHSFSIDTLMSGDSEMGAIEFSNTQTFEGEHAYSAVFE